MAKQRHVPFFSLVIVLASVPLIPASEFVYVTYSVYVNSAAAIAGFSIDSSTGALTSVPGSAFTLGAGDLTSVAADPKGRFLYVTRIPLSGYSSPNDIWVFAIDPATGSLSPIPGSPFAVAAGLWGMSIAIHPTGKFAYVMGEPGVINVFSIDSTTGSLALIERLATPVFPYHSKSIAIDPTGRFVYAPSGGGQQEGMIYAFAVDMDTGRLTAVPGSPFISGGAYPSSVAIHPSGRFVYVSDEEDFSPFPLGKIWGYAVDSSTGALTRLRGSPFGAAGGPDPVVVDPLGRFVFVEAGPLLGFAVDVSTGYLIPIAEPDPNGSFFIQAVDCIGRFALGYGNDRSSFAAAFVSRIDPQSGAVEKLVEAIVGEYGDRPTDIAVACPTMHGPISLVSPLPTFETTPSFTVRWSGIDGGGPSVQNYTLYSSDNGGSFAPWLTQTTSTQATFTGVSGHTYGFYSIAQDSAGNVEGSKSAAEATTYVDAVKPVSHVSSLPATESSPYFTVQWSGTDLGGPGIANYSIYVSDNGGAFAVWLSQTTSTQATFNGTNGHSYGFYSIVQDTYGILENSKSLAEATTTVQGTVPKPVSHVSAPATPPSPNFQVQWSGTDTGGPGIRNYNIYVADLTPPAGPVTLWQSNTTATQAWYAGYLGHTYGFFSQATDTLGNLENLRSAADATTQTPATSTKDVNHDGLINCTDLDVVKAALGSTPNAPNWNAAADINNDGVIDIRDLAAVSQMLIPGTKCN